MPEAAMISSTLLVVTAASLIGATLYFRFRSRELEHRERMSAFDKGVPLPPVPTSGSAPWTPRAYLLRGLVYLFTGLALFLLLGGLTLSAQHETSAETRVRAANWAKSNGATEEQVQAVMNDRRQDGPSPALALIGLIPIGIGLAYLITYRIETKAVRIAN